MVTNNKKNSDSSNSGGRSNIKYIHRVKKIILCPCRLRLSPSPPPTKVTGSRSSASAAHSRSIHLSAGSSPAKRRRPNDTDSEASSFAGGTVARTRISQQASASGRVTVDEVDLEGRYIRLSNKADEVRRCFCFFVFLVHFPEIYIFFPFGLPGSEHGELAGEAAGGVWRSHPLQVPGEVHPEGRSKGHGE